MKKKVLFICQANIGRSQMAEGFFNALTASNGAISAAVEDFCEKYQFRPTVEIVSAMAERGIDISNQRMKVVTPAMCESADRIIVLCAKSLCPKLLLENPKAVFAEIQDPFGQAEGTIRRIRDQIEALVRAEIQKGLT